MDEARLVERLRELANVESELGRPIRAAERQKVIEILSEQPEFDGGRLKMRSIPSTTLNFLTRCYGKHGPKGPMLRCSYCGTSSPSLWRRRNSTVSCQSGAEVSKNQLGLRMTCASPR